MKRLFDGVAVWLLVGAIGWAGIAWIGWTLWQSNPPRAGFDLGLLLDAARRVTAGQSPYDPSMLAGTSPDAASLFYSYPPLVAQAMTLLAWLPNAVVLVLWAIGASLGLGLVTWRLAVVADRAQPALDAVKAVAIVPLVLPFAVATLFGNLDAWYGLAFGSVVLVVLARPSDRRVSVAGGIALGLVSVAKLHPASLLVWFALRWFHDRPGSWGRTLVAAVATGVVCVVISVLIGGLGPWQDYVSVVRAGAGASVIDARNVGPVSLLGQLVPLSADGVRLVQLVVSLVAVLVTAIAAIRVRDPLASLSVAIAASLVVLPVTWYHYPVALLPVGIALVIMRPASRARVAMAAVVADLSIAFIPLLWLAVVVLVLATRVPGRVPDTRDAQDRPRLRVLPGGGAS